LGYVLKNQDFSSRRALIFPYLPMETSMCLTGSIALWRHLSNTIGLPKLPPNCRQKLKKRHNWVKFGGMAPHSIRFGGAGRSALARATGPRIDDEVGIEV
jgi:hypothetical protein